MPDTGERREVKRFVNAQEDESTQESNKLAARIKAQDSRNAEDTEARKRRTTAASSTAKQVPSDKHATDQEASNRMADEGDPNQLP